MRKLDEVETARALMREGQEWSFWRWLLEKRRVRAAADRATAALAQANGKIKESWSDDLKQAYAGSKSKHLEEKVRLAARRVREADEVAARATLAAEEMFAEAERRMSSGMAREAARKALESYDLRESAIRKAEAARRG